jgi:hypothetical protein
MLNEEGNTPEVDELDTWFDDTEEEDESAEEEVAEFEGTSPEDEPTEPAPDEEIPEPDAASAALEEGTPTSTPEPADDDPYSWVAELDPTFREKVEGLVQSDRSQKGRVAALQRQLDGVSAQQEARERTQTSGAAPQAVPDGKKLEDMSDEELDTFLEEYPSVARNVEKLIERRVSQEREDIMRQVRPIQEEALQEKIANNKAALRTEAEYIFNSDETGIYLDDVLSSRAFHEWVGSQSPEYQQFARSAESVDAAAKVLSDFAMYADQVVRVNATHEEERAAAEEESSRAMTADQTAARRRQARQGTSPRSRSANIGDRDTGDYDAIFNSLVEADEMAS